ncbi:helix-turn-helix domain-containing protein [Clostridium bowmanii]|uniref:DUF6320 domain-containing protein n=1 Tax=Clostridium bowmanii TaxID=132925 RepID=UPI001C0C8299|nr:DUF6320 domain-containing protein [Clostridium bowmanii]MBU3192023.1 helix-turn-helix domain-containing protein [Clostridium bowmanii]MCA1076303.1 helix-turn-helix domain-containing protein [Clostridium bowmanii]
MDNKKMGEFIYVLRKAKAMTQKTLAEKLNVTDKAVSKWERGNGYPEITIIPELAKELGVTVNELICGEKIISERIDLKDEVVVNNTIKYVEKVKKINTSNVFLVISLTFLFSAFVCLICNFAISGLLNWSLYPLGGLLIIWFTIIPIFFIKKHRGLISMFIMTVGLVPYLFLIEYLCPYKGWVLPLAIPIAGVVLIAFFIVIALFLNTKINRYYIVASTCLLFGVIVNIIIKNIVYNYIKENGINISVAITALSIAFVSFLIFIIGLLKKREDLKSNKYIFENKV